MGKASTTEEFKSLEEFFDSWFCEWLFTKRNKFC
jgi:hypothetical protein